MPKQEHTVDIVEVNPTAQRPYIVVVDGTELRDDNPRFDPRTGNQQASRITRFANEDSAKRAAKRFIESLVD